jgi:hypothetical protein
MADKATTAECGNYLFDMNRNINFKLPGFLLALAGLAIMGLVIFKLTTGSVPALSQPDRTFKLSFLDGSAVPDNPGYKMEMVWPLLQEAYPDSVVHSLTMKDIVSYNWEKQVMILTPEATGQLLARTSQPQKALIYPGLYLQGSLFVVSVDETPIYGGMFNFPESAMAIQYPVVYPSLENNQLVLTIRPFHTISPAQYDDFSETNPEWNGIKDDRIFKALSEAGKLEK